MYAKQGVTTFNTASNGLGYDPMTYSDLHLQAKEDNLRVMAASAWSGTSTPGFFLCSPAVQIYVGWSWMDEEVLWVDAQGIRPTDAGSNST